jgi:hypothetical protein
MRVLTTDVFAGAYLMTQGARLVDLLVDRTGVRSSGTFVFEGDNLLALQEAYSLGEATARVKDIRDAVTQLRSRLAGALQKNSPRRQTLPLASNL